MFHIHRWEKWSNPQPGTVTRSFAGTELGKIKCEVQSRTCKGCGLVDLREVAKVW